MLFKVNNDFYVLEHKLTNGCGGSQNAEINEIIQFINYTEENKDWHYVSCLQGNFFKKLNENNKEPKSANQYKNVINNLNQNPNNFFINGKGFEKLIHDLVSRNTYNIDDLNVLLNEYIYNK